MAAENFAWNRVFSFSQSFCLFWKKKKCSSEIHVFQSDQFLLLMYRCLLLSSAKCQNGLQRKHGKCSLCNEWWHSFMNQRLNHLVLLYKKCNCRRIMSLNTYNKNVDIIWHYCILSQIKPHGFWKRSALTNMTKDALKYMINRLWYGIFHITCHINPRPILALGSSALGLIWASRVDMTCDMKNDI